MKLIRIETRHDNIRDQHLTVYAVSEKAFNELVKPERFDDGLNDELMVSIDQNEARYWDSWPNGSKKIIGIKRNDGTYEYRCPCNLKLIETSVAYDGLSDQKVTAYAVTEEDFQSLVKPERFKNLKVTDRLRVTVWEDGTVQYYDRWTTGKLRLIGTKKADGTYEYHYS